MQYLLSVIPYVGSEIDNAHPNERGPILEKFSNRDDAESRMWHLVETKQIQTAEIHESDKRHVMGRRLVFDWSAHHENEDTGEWKCSDRYIDSISGQGSW